VPVEAIAARAETAALKIFPPAASFMKPAFGNVEAVFTLLEIPAPDPPRLLRASKSWSGISRCR